ncbi:Alcohol dehydrogenase superfamily, zinc-type [Cordyceps fumosorosea ARSEF 2679]|uniref:Alcohol dehydrogenase superfamily, zinc-type n=1 Tax=Cordyceps fumosorosea (strain ARSEF 2679) TaxID=1081104 RepID=A0A167LQ14_CORFA|nr:Alcohol dehydrogenase superfamily, zinc-type [Cordyceps fumosorosea ARSEF 2679]OAA53356.1 Alcohol dehydrogenase superfamily, zinc-type [Cordyceps fumosorosea ARSEF 2679]
MTPTAPDLDANYSIPHERKAQSALLLKAPREKYTLVNDFPIPTLQDAEEILVQTEVIGLNPIDWKSPDFNFGIPHLPFLPGRELVGIVTQSHAAARFRRGDRIIAISTDYRDGRKAAYQEFVVALSYNAVRLPPQMSSADGAALGVAFVTAALALGSCFGLSFSDSHGGPDLRSVIRRVGGDRIPEDVRHEALHSIEDHERALDGDWIAIWGGSATSACLLIQLARLAGLKVAVVVDQARHGFWLSTDGHVRPDLLIDNSDPKRAVEVLSATIGERLYFGIDTSGKDSAAFLLRALQKPPSGESQQSPSPPPTPPTRTPRRRHLIGLAGLPVNEYPKELQMHSVPLKLFHEVPEVGRALSEWMEVLLHSGRLHAPRILGIHSGLADVNKALDRMRNGEIRGGKLVVTV